MFLNILLHRVRLDFKVTKIDRDGRFETLTDNGSGPTQYPDGEHDFRRLPATAAGEFGITLGQSRCQRCGVVADDWNVELPAGNRPGTGSGTGALRNVLLLGLEDASGRACRNLVSRAWNSRVGRSTRKRTVRGGSGELADPTTLRQLINTQNAVVEHKGVYPRLGSEALILFQAQSLTWDTFCTKVSQIDLVAVYLQLIQQLAWDTLSHLRISDEIAGILITFYFAHVLQPLGRHSQEILRIRRKFLSRTVAKVPTEKKLSRTPFLVAYRIEGLEMSKATGGEISKGKT